MSVNQSPLQTAFENRLSRATKLTREQTKEVQAWVNEAPTLSLATFIDRAGSYIWLSAYAHNNPTSAYHIMADLCYDEALRRGDATIYDRAFELAKEG